MSKRKYKRVLAPKNRPPLSNKIPRQSQQQISDQAKPVWQLNLLDWDGPWGWRDVEATKWQEILQKLGTEETRTYLDDIDELFSLRLSGKERICGILDNHIFKILWWDPNHEVWPSTKKYT